MTKKRPSLLLNLNKKPRVWILINIIL